MKKLDKILIKLLFYFCGSLMFLMTAAVTAQVVSRYVFGNPFTWTEELGRYTFVWVSFLGMAAGIKGGSHIALDILVKALKGVNRKFLMIFNNLLVFVFAVFLTISGINLVELGTRQHSPSLGLPMGIVYIVIPISGLLLIYFVLSETVQVVKRKGDGV